MKERKINRKERGGGREREREVEIEIGRGRAGAERKVKRKKEEIERGERETAIGKERGESRERVVLGLPYCIVVVVVGLRSTRSERGRSTSLTEYLVLGSSPILLCCASQ